MITAILIVVAVVLALLALQAAQGNAPRLDIGDDLQSVTEAVDLPAFLNLVDPTEEEYLRANLSPRVFRRVQRCRLLAATEYVRRVAKNAAVVVQLGEAAKAEANPEASRLGQELVTAAIQLRVFALLALCLLYLNMVVPNIRLSHLQIPDRYEHLTDAVRQLGSLNMSAQPGRTLQLL